MRMTLKGRKLLCLLLSVCVILACNVPATATACDISPVDMIDFSTIHWDNDDMIYKESQDEVIEALSFEGLEADKSLQRMRDEEGDLYTVIYRDLESNLSTAYFFEEPVKYIDESGEIRDIDTSITPCAQNLNVREGTEYRYSSENNSVKVYYPSSMMPGNALMATREHYSISLGVADTPQLSSASANSTAKLGAELVKGSYTKDYIDYEGAFGPGTLLRYYTTYSGYKEQIWLENNTGKTRFSFTLDTNGLVPVLRESGSISLIDLKENLEIGSIAPILVYDQAYKETLNNHYEITKENDGSYVLTLCVDEMFLNDETTVYPVIIDPTFSFHSDDSTLDAMVYSGAPNAALGENHYHHIGYCDDTYKVGYLLVKFPALANSTFFNNLSSNRIDSVTYNVNKIGGNTANAASLAAYYYTGAPWSETTVTYNSADVANKTGSLLSSASMTLNGWYSFDITLAAKNWKNGTSSTYSYDKGIVIKNITNSTSSSYSRVLASTEYGNLHGDYMPYVAVEYRNGYTSGGFDSADLAALDFATALYSTGMYLRFECCAVIYKSGTQYYYTNVQIEAPHNCNGINIDVPSGTTYVGYIHTHPNAEEFSSNDKSYAIYTGGNAYVVTPLRKIYRYNYLYDTETTVANSFLWHALTDAERSTLASNCEAAWNAHLVAGCSYGCSRKIWPNPDF